MPTNRTPNRLQARDIIRAIPFFRDLPEAEFDEIERVIIRKRIARNQIVLFEEDTGNFMYIIFSGRVRVVHLSDDGKEQILAIHKRGEYFGEMSLFDGKTSPATVISMEETEVGLLAKPDFQRIVYRNATALHHFIGMLCDRLRESWLMLKIMSFADAEQRVRAVLKNMGALYGTKEQQGVILALKLTHRDIANYASVSRETASRLLSKFVKSGEIEILRNKFILLKSRFLDNLHAL
ncbi:Crp/Fnr family transcriptional regulator [Geobacter sp. DSM 9736]|uniref:Crp/Fnr family transcriptional regulator n=1 Tax=Geobacter sp. DSM 9736 TaxID=1277350 RepID=UPI000B50FC69|nr:Crp/Fnr family transcriptional regulator [Geobacter sp. DSM 9736]SNB46126.1 CRP/FNR family transcriptional regulator, anaerobic regulatory protein [Geobacter sp. DSM 9736]